MSTEPSSLFSEPVRAWFESSFPEPTRPQALGWPAIASGEHTLILSPTGSGKTLSAFLWGLDRLMSDPVPDQDRRTRLLYISPLRALAVDVEKNLRSPLRGIVLAAERLGSDVHLPTVGMRTGDTPANERRSLVRRPPDLLITTPESLYLMLTSAARETLRNVDAVIIDEIHSVAGTKRGAHLAITLERLEHLVGKPVQRIGLSATQRPLDEIARFLGGRARTESGSMAWRDVTVVDAGTSSDMELEVIVPIADMSNPDEVDAASSIEVAPQEPTRGSLWPSVHPRILDQVKQHTSTIVFVNSRRLAERLAGRLNEMWDETEPPQDLEMPRIAAHHGSLSKVKRLEIEDALKNGRLRAIVATSSLELGIDMGAVDLVVQVESPGAVSRGLQRVGRAGHQVGAASRGKIFPKHRSDLLETAVVVDRMVSGDIERTTIPKNPLDVIAQQIVAMVALDDWPLAELQGVIRGAANCAELSDDVFESVLDLLGGRYPSEEFAELRPRLVWDRVGAMVRGRKGAQRLAVTNAGTIPDRGLYGVFLPDGTRVGELDEEMVYESRPGEVFLLGASSWRIEDITFERVVVTPAPGEPGKMPFWHGDGPGRPIELGQAMGAFVRELEASSAAEVAERLSTRHALDELAAGNITRYLAEQREATGVVPDDRTIVVERFRDEIGDWRVCILSPFGAQVHAPWGMVLRSRLSERWGVDVEMMWADDGIVIRLPEAIDEIHADDLIVEPTDIESLVIAELPGSALFASRFRECAGRSLLLPRRRPDQRTPLWQQRQRSADLLKVAAKYPSFPILLEATRECLNDVFDVPALREVLTGLSNRSIQMVHVESNRASPFAQSLLFGWIAQYMYEGDAPLAERRAAALSLDKELLRDLLGAEELRELLDAGVVADVELELQRLADGWRARDVDELHDLLRVLGPLDRTELDARSELSSTSPSLDALLEELLTTGRAIESGIGGELRFADAADAGRLRDAIGVPLPVGLPAVFTDSVDDPLGDLLYRFARTHGPFTSEQVAQRFGLTLTRVEQKLAELAKAESILKGEFRPGGRGYEWVDDGVLRQLRRRSLAALRAEVAPVEQQTLAKFLPVWQGIGLPRRGPDGLAEVIASLQGASLPASLLEPSILSQRMRNYRPADLDQLCMSGEVVWIGMASAGARDGRLMLAFRDQVDLFAPVVDEETAPSSAIHNLLRAELARSGARFWHELVEAVGKADEMYRDDEVLRSLWELVWAGQVTNDSLAPLRAWMKKGGSKGRATSRRRPRVGQIRATAPPSAAGRWSLVVDLIANEPTKAQRLTALALQLVERYGVLTREAALGEGISGGFAGVYPILKELETRGDVRRGYFVEGLGAAQFALPGAVDRLRSLSANSPHQSTQDESRQVEVLAASDPAQPYGASLPWPETTGRPARTTGSFVVIVEGFAAVQIDRTGKSIVAFPASASDPRWIEGLKDLVRSERLRTVEVAKINGEHAGESPLAAMMVESGFVRTYKGYSWRQ